MYPEQQKKTKETTTTDAEALFNEKVVEYLVREALTILEYSGDTMLADGLREDAKGRRPDIIAKRIEEFADEKKNGGMSKVHHPPKLMRSIFQKVPFLKDEPLNKDTVVKTGLYTKAFLHAKAEVKNEVVAEA